MRGGHTTLFILLTFIHMHFEGRGLVMQAHENMLSSIQHKSGILVKRVTCEFMGRGDQCSKIVKNIQKQQ